MQSDGLKFCGIAFNPLESGTKETEKVIGCVCLWWEGGREKGKIC